MREKTHAHRRYIDNVDEKVKGRRLEEIVSTFHQTASKKNELLIGSQQTILVDSEMAKIRRGVPTRYSGRTDGGHKLFIIDESSNPQITKGDFVTVQVEQATSASLIGRLLQKSQ